MTELLLGLEVAVNLPSRRSVDRSQLIKIDALVVDISCLDEY